MKRYSSSEPLVFLWIAGPYILFMNLLIFGLCVFDSLGIFLRTFSVSALYFFLIYGLFGSFAVIVKNRYPSGADLFKRVSILLPGFYLMNIAAIYGACYVFTDLIDLGCKPRPELVWWTILYGCIMSTVITFINEGIANWEKWKDSLSESEKLKNAYQRSKLLGLKGQINPHFLFNCFNTLSGLISEDETEAEKFLDEMTKVHRYLLRGDDEFLVSVQEEIQFAKSYLFLIKARFGSAIDFVIDVPPTLMDFKIPPLSLQVILENIIYTNALHKKEPLIIHIGIGSQASELMITHSQHIKVIVQHINEDEGLDNLLIKYRLLGSRSVRITEMPMKREIILPLFDKQMTEA